MHETLGKTPKLYSFPRAIILSLFAHRIVFESMLDDTLSEESGCSLLKEDATITCHVASWYVYLDFAK